MSRFTELCAIFICTGFPEVAEHLKAGAAAARTRILTDEEQEKEMKEMKHHLEFTAIMAAWILTFALVAAPVSAEEKKADVSNMEILRKKIKADMKLLVAANMGLTEAEAKAFWPIYQEYQSN